MFKKPHCPVIAIEEHYWDDELEKNFTGGEAGRPGEQYSRLKDLGPLRLKEMDEAGIDIQVLSHGAPSTQKLPAETAAGIARAVNDRLHKTVAGNPARFAAFAALPTAVPEAAADELERTAALGFKGAMLHGLAAGESLFQFVVPVMLLDGNDRTMRFLEQAALPFLVALCAERGVVASGERGVIRARLYFPSPLAGEGAERAQRAKRVRGA